MAISTQKAGGGRLAYPVRGAQLLPSQLTPWLGDVKVAAAIRKRYRLPDDLTLADLDETVWDSFPSDAVRACVTQVVQAVRGAWPDLRLSDDRSGGALAVTALLAQDVPLSTRAHNVLTRTAKGQGSPSELTVGRLTEVPGLGAQTLLEILTKAELLAASKAAEIGPGQHEEEVSPPRPSPKLKRAAETLVKRRWSRKVRSGDPRLGHLIKSLSRQATTAREAGERLLAAPPPLAYQASKAVEIKDLMRNANTLRAKSLVEEMDEILGALMRTRRGVDAVKLRLGLGDAAPMTLQEVGDKLGVTRERIRQLQRGFLKGVERRQPWLPVLRKAVQTLRVSLPLTEEEVQQTLREAGFLREDDHISTPALVTWAALFRKKPPFEMVGDMLAPAASSKAVPAVGPFARKFVTHWGASTVDELRASLVEEEKGEIDDATTRRTLATITGFSWLDQEAGWFWIRGTARNRLLNQIEKIMSVAGSIEIGDLRNGVGRHHRMKGFRPPREVLARLCQDTGLYERHGDRIVGGDALPDWHEVLGGIEAKLVSILFEDGPLMQRDELERRAVDEEGVNRSSFYIYLSYSPVLQRYAPGVFGLRGAPTSAAEVKALIPPRTRQQVLQDHGWAADGSVWIAYKLSRSSAASGVVGVPAVLDDLLQGSYRAITEDGRPVGTVVVDDSMWGLSPFLRRWGVEAGDYLIASFDLSEGTSTLVAGTEDLLVRQQKGE